MALFRLPQNFPGRAYGALKPQVKTAGRQNDQTCDYESPAQPRRSTDGGHVSFHKRCA